MNRLIFSFIFISSLFFAIPFASAQELAIGERADQKSVTITISNEGEVQVKHVVKSSNSPQQMKLIDGSVQNLSIIDEEGDEQIPTIVGNNDSIMIMPSDNNLVIEYDLEDALIFKDGYWTWDFLYLESITFILPQKADLIFANESPVLIEDTKGVRCHGCQMMLQYSFTESKIVENVKWEERDFDVEIRTLAELNDFTFEQSEKSITLDVNDADRFVTIIIPLELLWEPYTVFIDDEKIRVHKFLSNGTHVGLGFKSAESGEILIVGTTVVPEFPIFAPLVVGLMAILVMPFLRKFNLR